MILLTWIFSFLFFTCVSFLIIQRFFQKRLMMERRLAPFITIHTRDEVSIQRDEINNKNLYERLIGPYVKKIRQLTVGKLPTETMTKVEKRLHAAGYPFDLTAGDFLILQMVLPAALFLLILLLLLPPAEVKLQIIILAIVGALFVYVYTNYYLTAKGKQRTELIDKSLPDFFDLLNVSIEAGMGLDGALKKVCSQMDTPLSREFLSALEDMKLGKTRRQAFIELRERVSSEFFKSVLTSIIQADQMGLGMSKVLQTQATRIREKQRFQVKEKAMKAPVKMLIPMVLFIFPTLFVVLIGPVIVQLVTQFF